jgi:hypothetical protein
MQGACQWISPEQAGINAGAVRADLPPLVIASRDLAVAAPSITSQVSGKQLLRGSPEETGQNSRLALFMKKQSPTLPMTVVTRHTHERTIQPGDSAESNQGSITSGSFPGMLTVNGAGCGLLSYMRLFLPPGCVCSS